MRRGTSQAGALESDPESQTSREETDSSSSSSSFSSFFRVPTLPKILLLFAAVFAMFHLLSLGRAPSDEGPLANRRYYHQLIFTISSGRVGTGYLASLLGTAPNVSAFHEPEPVMVGRYLHLTDEGPMKDSYNERKIKVEAIRHTLRTVPIGNVYAETNSNFIRTFYDVVVEEFHDAQIYVVILRRYLPEVLKSLVELGHFDGNPAAENFISSSNSFNKVLPPCWHHDHKPTQFELLSHYLVDTEARVRRFQTQYSSRMNVKILEVELKDLLNIHRIEKTFRLMRIETTQKTENLVGIRVNERVNVKSKYGNSATNTTMEFCRDRLEEYLKACERMNIAVPPLPQMIVTSPGPSTWL